MDLIRSDRVVVILLGVALATAAVVVEFTRRALEADPRRRRTIASMVALTVCSSAVIAGAHDTVVLVGWIGSGWALVAMLTGDGPGVHAARRRTVASLLVGDLALAAAFLVGTDRSGATDLVAVLLVLAGLSRSALVPFHRWLIGTITAPTPISAIVHAGLVSGAGLLLVRHHELFAASTPAVLVAATSATATVIVAARVRRPDAKGALAWSTVGQMAVMVLQCSVGAFSSAVIHIAGHGMYKAARFLGVGGTVAAAVQRQRSRPPAERRSDRLVAAVTATAAVGSAFLLVPPDLVPAGQLLVVVLAWATVAAAVRGWMSRCPTSRPVAVALAATCGSVVTVTYFSLLRLVEAFLSPDLTSLETAVGPEVLAGLVVAATVVGGVDGATARRRPASVTARSSDPGSAELRSDVAIAASCVAPLWPLSSFVAVNPLGGLEPFGFDDATARVRRWTGARTHLTLDEYRADHARGVTRLADLEYAVHQRLPDVSARPAVAVDGRLVDPVDIVTADLLHGPTVPSDAREPTRLELLGRPHDDAVIDAFVAEQAADHVTSGGTSPDFVAAALAAVRTDRRLRRLVDVTGRAWLDALGSDPASVVATAGARLGVEDHERVDEFRRHLLRLPGWVGHARWRTEWATPAASGPPLAPIDLLAVRMAIEAAAVGTAGRPDHVLDRHGQVATVDRVAAVAARLAPAQRPDDLTAIRDVLALVPLDERPAVWLAAQERAFDERLLGVLGRVDPGRSTRRPEVQAVFCIDVRSEGVRRHLEEIADVETFGFAGFFGLPIDVRRVGWDRPEPRCPVLVSPAMTATEHVDPTSAGPVARRLQRSRWTAAVTAAHDRAKQSFGAPFALAEGLGWGTGPAAAWRTFRPARSEAPRQRPTRMLLDDRILVEQKIFAAESILRTMGLLDGFAPLVLLCGHTSATVNNAHATALDCGACGGASGEDNALAVAALLNSPDVRHGLASRGIIVPEDTWFVAGVHDTTSDRVTVLDAGLAPDTHTVMVDRLTAALAAAGAAQSADRSSLLPGRASRVRDRGADWAQVRPEWGLARAATFIIAPRSTTTGLDLDGRAFLHGYDAGQDPDGTVLETIMTAPMIVAHWITSQYYFSTVDPEVFGAGDKLVHNPIGAVGVVSGDGGDLRVGLPLQSTHVARRRHHQPLRLLVVIQADLEAIERIIARHRLLQHLVEGSWIRIAARSLPHEPWSTRTPAGTWITCPRPLDTVTTMVTDQLMSTSGLGG